MLKKKIWDIFNKTRPEPITPTQTKKKDKNNIIVLKIIKKKTNFNIYTNIIRKHNLY